MTDTIISSSRIWRDGDPEPIDRPVVRDEKGHLWSWNATAAAWRRDFVDSGWDEIFWTTTILTEVPAPLWKQHTISVERLTPELRRELDLRDDPSTFAIIERHGGRLGKFCNSTSNRACADLMAVSYAHTYGAQIVETA